MSDGKAWFITPESILPLLTRGEHALCHPSWHLVLDIVILYLSAAVRPWKAISWSSWYTVLMMLLPEAVWSSVVNDSAEDRWLCGTGTQRPCSESLHCLLFHGRAVVAPRCFYFTVIALIVDQGRSSRTEISRTYLWQSWHPKTIPCLKSVSSSVLFTASVCL